MKKFLNLITLTLCTILLVGCGSGSKRILSCSKDYSKDAGLPDGVVLNLNVDTTFKKNKIQDITITATYDLNDTYAKEADSVMDKIKQGYDKHYVGEHFEVKTEKKSDSSFSIIVKMDYKKMNDEEKKIASLDNISSDDSYNTNRINLVQEGFKCK